MVFNVWFILTFVMLVCGYEADVFYLFEAQFFTGDSKDRGDRMWLGTPHLVRISLVNAGDIVWDVAFPIENRHIQVMLQSTQTKKNTFLFELSGKGPFRSTTRIIPPATVGRGLLGQLTHLLGFLCK